LINDQIIHRSNYKASMAKLQREEALWLTQVYHMMKVY
jgi:hypothetical protein